MRCAICKKEENEIPLYEGILGAGMIRICEPCSETEKIPLIRKPSSRQLEKADERYSVRERMEQMSGVRDKTEISDEQVILQGNLAKLRAPPKKQTRDDIEDNYSWNITMARRRLKMSTTQVANEINVDPKIVAGIERGRIPEDYREVFRKLEKFLRIPLLKFQEQEISFRRNVQVNEEKEILKKVQERMSNPEAYEDENEERFEVDEIVNIGNDGNLVQEEAPIEDKRGEITIDSLLRRKRQKEKEQNKGKPKLATDAMLGDEIELDIDEV